MSEQSHTNNNKYRFWFFPGAQRVGTHFQLNTVIDALKQKNISYIHHPGNEIHADDISKFRKSLHDLEKSSASYILVNYHWRTQKERDFLLSIPNALYFFIWRDFRDAMISYYHFLINRRERTFNDFTHYYWTEGWQFLWRQSIHYQTWNAIHPHPRVFDADFSRMATQFEEEAGRMLKFAGLDGVDLADLESKVSIKNRRISDGDEKGDFYRQGQIGEYFEVVKDIKIRNHVERVLRWGKVSNSIYKKILYQYLVWESKRNLN